MIKKYSAVLSVITRLILVMFLMTGFVAGVAEGAGDSPGEFRQEGFPRFLQASRVTVLSASVNGVVDRILHEPQDYVNKGELLIQLDDELIRLEEESLLAQIELSTADIEAKIRLDYAQDSLAIVQQLYDKMIGGKRAASVKELKEGTQSRDLALQGKKKAELEMRLLKLKLASARKQRQMHAITAPIQGVIVPFSSVKNLEERNIKRVEEGEMVAVSQPVMALMDVGRMRVMTQLMSTVIDEVFLGQEATVYVQGSAKPISAVVVFKSPTIGFALDIFEIEVEFDNPLRSTEGLPKGAYPYQFRPGMRARVDLVTDKK
jgi:multidrug efflux pump subunit AcrA (membrane-fusion protein)